MINFLIFFMSLFVLDIATFFLAAHFCFKDGMTMHSIGSICITYLHRNCSEMYSISAVDKKKTCPRLSISNGKVPHTV